MHGARHKARFGARKPSHHRRHLFGMAVTLYRHESMRQSRMLKISSTPAARRYSENPAGTGCIVLEGSRCSDQEARELARAAHAAAAELIRSFIADRHPDAADTLTEYMSTVMIGLSAQARAGKGQKALLDTARLASRAFASALSD